MINVTVLLTGISPYSQSRPIATPRGDRETAQDHEKRVWQERMHVNAQGEIFIPPMAFKNCLSEAAKFLSIQIPGKGKATYTKHFEAGVLVVEGMSLGVKADDVEGEWLFLPSDGKRGGGKRVWKCYPKIPHWSGSVTFHILDETITESVFKRVLEGAGSFIGIGRFRPRNNGFYGRFKIESIQWQAEALAEAA